MPGRHPDRGLAPGLMLLGVVVWSWAWWSVAALTGQGWLTFPTVLLSLAGALGPLVVPALLLWSGYGDESPGAFLRRCFDPRTLPLRWYAGLAMLLLVFALVPVLLARGVAGLSPEPAGPVAFLLVGIVVGAIEEPAWRGYALPGLQRRMPVIAASLAVGAVWSVWHLPLFFLEGTYQQSLGVGTTGFWLFLAGPVAIAPVYGWLHNVTGGVVFAAVVLHGLGNASRELWDPGAPLLQLGFEALLALTLTAVAWRWMSRPAPARSPAAGTGSPR